MFYQRIIATAATTAATTAAVGGGDADFWRTESVGN